MRFADSVEREFFLGWFTPSGQRLRQEGLNGALNRESYCAKLLNNLLSVCFRFEKGLAKLLYIVHVSFS